MRTLQATIDAAFERRADITPSNVDAAVLRAVEDTVGLLDSGKARVAEKKDGHWVVHEWLKKACSSTSARTRTKSWTPATPGSTTKCRSSMRTPTEPQLRAGGVRVVPHAIARRGSYIAPNTVLMPSYVNIGAYVDTGTMVDTWVTVGSCAQIARTCISQAASASAACSNRCSCTHHY